MDNQTRNEDEYQNQLLQLQIEGKLSKLEEVTFAKNSTQQIDQIVEDKIQQLQQAKDQQENKNGQIRKQEPIENQQILLQVQRYDIGCKQELNDCQNPYVNSRNSKEEKIELNLGSVQNNVLNSKGNGSGKISPLPSPRGIIKRSSTYFQKKNKTNDTIKFKDDNYAEELKDSLKLLTSESMFMKYCFNKQLIQDVFLSFSLDFQLLICRSQPSTFDYLLGNSKNTILNISSFLNMYTGTKSDNFQRYIKNKYQISEEKAFSLILNNRTIDLVAESVQKRDKFIEAIKKVQQYL